MSVLFSSFSMVESSEPIVHNDMYNSSITLLVHSFPVAAKNKIEIKLELKTELKNDIRGDLWLARTQVEVSTDFIWNMS